LNDSKWTWRAVSLVSILATLLLITGFVYAVGDILNPKGEKLLSSLPQETAVPTAAASDEYKILALGDSLAKGTGDNTGEGFVRRTLTALSANEGKAELLGNMGINGLTTTALESKLKEEGVQYALRQANVILISIGGNDLFRGSNIMGTPATPKFEGSKPVPTASANDLTPESLLSALPEAAKRLGSILDTVAKINPQAQVYYIGLYNPFGDIPELLTPGNQAVTAWNNTAMDMINKHSNMTLVPTFDLFDRHLDKYLSNDHFHPNGDGYQRMSERIVQAVR
jgi:lysophospholipase L1-like esterase